MQRVSVILPTYNRLGQLKRVIAGLENQTYPLTDFEVIVVSDGSSDGTNDYLRSIVTPLSLRPILQDNQGVAMARNNGVDMATGSLLVFIDDDVMPEPMLVSEHVAWHDKHDEEVVVMGPMLTPDEFDMAPWVQWEQAMLVKQYDSMMAGEWEPTARQFYTGNTSVARSHVVKCGGFDPTFKRAEDVELAYRLSDLGVRFLFNPQAIGYHYAIRSFASWQAIPYAYGRNDVIFHEQKGQDWILPTICREYRGRNVLIRKLVEGCLDREGRGKTAVFLLKQIAQLAHTVNIKKLHKVAYSGIFNLRFYQGVADQLGGRDKLYAWMQQIADLDAQQENQMEMNQLTLKKNEVQ